VTGVPPAGPRGLAIIVGFVIHVVLNSLLKEFPPENPTVAQLQAYLSREAGAWGVVHGFRYCQTSNRRTSLR